MQGWNGGVTQSMLGRFLSCRERFRLKYVLGLEPYDQWNHRLGYGLMWHKCEEAWARTGDPDKVVAELNDHTVAMMNRYPAQREEIDKWWNVCRVQFPEYVQYWQEHPDVLNRTPLLQEQVFDVSYTLPSRRVVRLRGRWDSVDLIHDETTGARGGIYLQENKTKGDVDKVRIERQLRFDFQTMLYLVALHENKSWDFRGHEKFVFAPIRGARYNVVRRPLSGGRGNIKPGKARATKNTYTPPETDEQFYERLRADYIAAEPEHYFFRVRVEITTHDIQVFRDTCLDPILEQLCWWYDTITGEPYKVTADWLVRSLNYRHPFGVYNALEENGATEYDAFLATGSEVGLRRTTELFTELK